MKNSPIKLLFNKLYFANELTIKQLNPSLNPDLYKLSDKFTNITLASDAGKVSKPVLAKPLPMRSTPSNQISPVQAKPMPSVSDKLISNNYLGWQELISQINSCIACKLCENRVNSVIERGSRQAKWLFVGEDAGEAENSSGMPFMAKQGELLAKMLTAMQLDINKDVYLTNIVKCVSALNKNPSLEDINACKNFLFNQINLIQPSIIVVFGKLASNALLKSGKPLNKLRLNKLDFNGIPLVVTYSLASLLRNEQLKKDTWLDLQFAMQRIKG